MRTSSPASMALKITCPHCGSPIRLDEPYPLPGTERQCACGRALSISYPMGLVDTLRRRGARFAEEPAAVATPPRPRAATAQREAVRNVGPAPIPPARADERERIDDDPTVHAAQVRAPTPRHATAPDTAAQARAASPGAASTPASAAPEASRAPGATVPGSAPREASRAPGPTAARSEPVSSVNGAVRAAAPPSSPPERTGPRAARTASPAPRARGWLYRVGVGGTGVALAGAALAAAALVGVFWWNGRDLPTLEALEKYRPPTVTVVYDQKGRLMGEIYEKRRYVVPMDTMPKHLVEAFVSAEDAAFYDHDGVDYLGIVRAVLRNAAKGKKAQGASTITQQVARNFLLSNEKTYTRKTKEVLLAWRIEEAFDKDEVLHLYLNQIYLGSGAYGVEAAARVYFGKHVDELTIAESAMIAGLPQRPSEYSPHRNFDAAKARQKYVLGQMVDNGYLTQAEADGHYAEPLHIVERTNEFLLKAPWFTEHVRRYLVDTYGEERVLNDGILVETTCDLDLQAEAQKAVSNGVGALDARGGWRGAAETLAADAFDAYVRKLGTQRSGLAEGERYAAVVEEVQKDRAVVALGDGARGVVPLAWSTWAYKKGSGTRKLDDLGKVLQRGDVITVEVTNRDVRDAKALEGFTPGEGTYAAVSLYQSPDIEGALYSYRLSDGAVLALVGGVDFKETKFNRAIQSSRQVGSTFKPIVYAAAIESKKFTTGTIVQDAPIVFNTLKSQLWKPENFGEDYLGDITLRHALAQSRNVVTIRVLDVIGLDPVYKMARKLGIESQMDVDLSMGLGSASLKMPELARAYSPFATLGKRIEPHYVSKVTDRDGAVLEQWTAPAQWEQVLEPSVAGVMSWLLQDVATSGTAAKAQRLGLHVGGKTGTTNDFRDAWFVGFTADVLTATWVGYDQPRSLGSSSTGGQVSLPIWMDYMEDAVPKPDPPFPVAPGLTWIGIDEKTGRPMQGGRSMPFLAGTAPKGTAAAAGQTTTEELLTTEF